MKSTITVQQQQAITRILSHMHLPMGLGDEDNACSIAAINLALSGELSDDIPPCMSEVVGLWIITIQDAIPDALRNSAEWKRLLPLAAGTGREREQERLDLIVAWIWESVLPTVQPVADLKGFGGEWEEMLWERTSNAAARAVAAAARAATAAAAAARVVAAVAAAADAADAAAAAARVVAAAAADAAADAADAARAAAAADAADAADADAARAADEAWMRFNPSGLLEQLIKLEG